MFFDKFKLFDDILPGIYDCRLAINTVLGNPMSHPVWEWNQASEYFAYIKRAESWQTYKMDSDWMRFEKQGFTKESFEQFRDIFNDMFANFNDLPYKHKMKGYHQFTVMNHYLRRSVAEKYLDQLSTLMENVPKNLKSKKELISCETFGNWDLKLNPLGRLVVKNPYFEIDKFLELLTVYMGHIQEALQYNVSDLIFPPDFDSLKNIKTNLEGKLDKDDMENVLSVCMSMILKSISTGYMKFKYTEEELKCIGSRHMFFKTTDEKVHYDTLRLLQRLMRINFNDPLISTNYRILDEIREKHQNDEAGSILSTFINDFVPLFEQTISPKNLIKLSMEYSKTFEHVADNVGKDNNQRLVMENYFLFRYALESKYFFAGFIEFLPYKLDECPNSAFEDILKKFLMDLCGLRPDSGCMTTKSPVNDEMKEMLNEIGDIPINTKNQQRYYATRHLINNLIQGHGSFNCIVVKLLPWHIDDDSEEARQLEGLIMELTRVAIKNVACESYGDPPYNNYNGVAENYFLNDEKPVLPPEMFINYIKNPPDYITFGDIVGMCCNIQ